MRWGGGGGAGGGSSSVRKTPKSGQVSSEFINTGGFGSAKGTGSGQVLGSDSTSLPWSQLRAQLLGVVSSHFVPPNSSPPPSVPVLGRTGSRNKPRAQGSQRVSSMSSPPPSGGVPRRRRPFIQSLSANTSRVSTTVCLFACWLPFFAPPR